MNCRGLPHLSLFKIPWHKKVLLRERKRHTARRVAIAISCYSGGVPWQNFFSPVWTCIKPNLVSKIFPFTDKGGCPSAKFFFPVWTCIKPNLVSKIFPFTETGDPPPPRKSETWDPPHKSQTRDPPPRKSQTRDPPVHGWIGYPPYLDMDLGPTHRPRRGVDWHTKWKYNLPHPSDAGGKKNSFPWQFLLFFNLWKKYLSIVINCNSPTHPGILKGKKV